MELWDAYDAKLKKIEGMTLVRGQKIPDGVFHLACDVAVRHTDGTYLIMKRDERKKYGGMWEWTAGGSALVGETPIDCAIRELYEETGIYAPNLKEVGKVVVRGDCTIFVEFFCVTNWDKNNISLQEGETCDYKWVSQDELMNMKDKKLLTRNIFSFVDV